MKKTFNTINYELLFSPTGDPFVDAGAYALLEFSKRFPECDILELIDKACDIYVDLWNAKLNTFFLNSKITQPSFDVKQKKDENHKYFKSLIENTSKYEKGFCRITGCETNLYPACRDNSTLTGSGKFANFHQFFQSGLMVSKEVLIRLFFLPLGCELLQGKISVIHSNNMEISELYSIECCKRNLNNIAIGISEGVLKSQSNSPGTALFRHVDAIIKRIETIADMKDSQVSLYFFTNFGASPELKIYSMKLEVFRFYRIMQNIKIKEDWNNFISKYYRNKDYKKSIYNQNKNIIVFENKEKQNIEIPEDEFKYWRNLIYDKLINGESILSNLLSYSKEKSINWEIIKCYQFIIRKMKNETIKKIEEIADFIFTSNDESGIIKIIKKLNSVKNPYLLRRFFIVDIVSKNYNEGNDKTIVTLEEYCNYLFPDTSSWQEMRDVLLIALYQRLHENKMHIEVELEENEINDSDN